MEMKIRKTALISRCCEKNEVIYYDFKIITTALKNGVYYIEDDILVFIVNCENDHTARNQMKEYISFMGNKAVRFEQHHRKISQLDIMKGFDYTRTIDELVAAMKRA